MSMIAVKSLGESVLYSMISQARQRSYVVEVRKKHFVNTTLLVDQLIGLDFFLK